MEDNKTLEQILKVSSKLFNKFGYDNVSTNLIAKTSNLSIGTLYYYFKNKQEILNSHTYNYFLDQKGISKKISNFYDKEVLFTNWIVEQRHYFLDNPFFKQIYFKILFEDQFLCNLPNVFKIKELWLELITNKTALKENHAIIFLGQIGVFAFSENLNYSFVKKQVKCILESYTTTNNQNFNPINQDLVLKEAEKLTIQ